MVQSASGTAVSIPEETATEFRFGQLNEAPRPRLGALRSVHEALAKTQRDIRVNTHELAVALGDGALMVAGSERYAMREHAFGQLCAKLQVRANYARRFDPGLRAQNLNRRLREQDRDVLLRVEGDDVRAVLSGSYRPINHLTILNWMTERLTDDTEVRYELNDSFLDLQVVADRPANGQQARHDPLYRGLHLRNSEVGLARVQVSALVYRRICLNGLVMAGGRWSYQRRHVGTAAVADAVKDAFDRALVMSRDAVKAFSGTQGIVVNAPQKALERITARYELDEAEVAPINRAFEVEPRNRLLDLVNALTRGGNDDALPLTSRVKLQELGGRIIDLAAQGRWIDN